MANTRKSSIIEQYHVDFTKVKESRTWFNNQVALMRKGRLTANKLLANSETLTTSIRPGALYLFMYDPKFKETLPYYDMFPLVFPFAPAKGGVLGLNLHYLPYPERFALFKKLIEINGKPLTDNIKMNFSWQMITAMAKTQHAGACVKHYLNEHVASPFMKIDSKDWTTVQLMPVEKFVGATKEAVWRDSRNK